MGYLSELFENADLANVFGGQDKKEKRLMDKMRGEYADSQTTMGSTLHGGAQPQAAQASPMPMQQQAPRVISAVLVAIRLRSARNRWGLVIIKGAKCATPI